MPDFVNFDIQCSTSEYNVFKYAKGVNYFIKEIRQIIFLIFFGEILECWRLLSEFSSFKKVHYERNNVGNYLMTFFENNSPCIMKIKLTIIYKLREL